MKEKIKKRKEKSRAARGLFFLFSLFFFLCPVLSSCSADFLPYAREVENMALMRTMGVDAAEDGVKVTVSSGVQSKGAEKGDQPPMVFSREAGTVSGACLAMQSYGTAYIFYGNVGQLLAGEDLARRGLSETLGYVERDIEMRLDTELFVVKGSSAAEAISASASGESSAADRLEALEDDAGLMAHSMPRTVREVLSDTACNGAAFAPAVELKPKKTESSGEETYELSAAGYAVFKGDALAGWARGDAAAGVNLLRGEVDADILELDGGEAPIALRVVGAKSAVRANCAGGTLSGLTVEVSVEANVAEAPAGLDLSDAEILERLERALCQTEERRVRAVLELSQSLDADFLGLGRAAGIAAPWNWAVIEAQWAGAFASLPVMIKVSAKIERSYDVK